jgi:hypothetical protein
MKIRKGFVSNSSSSSFICEVCGNVESGYDASAEDCGFYVCEKGHEFCQHHALPGFNSEHPKYEEYEDCGDYPSEFCPVCQLKAMSAESMLAYLLKKAGKTKNVVILEINEEFSDHAAFRQYITNRSV